ncbi:hypothetical protein JHFBIEKO_2566 [Methylobacterium mesophilicum]|nr:hypothetical protein JHFBIEKO_2566 [Methylobacterium mesophilicum]
MRAQRVAVVRFPARDILAAGVMRLIFMVSTGFQDV